MKSIIVFICAVALVSATSYTLVTHNSISVSVDISANSANSSNADVVWSLDYPDSLPAEVEDTTNPVVCFKSENSDYSIANSTSGLTTVAVKWACATGTGSCDSVDELGATFQQTSGTAGATAADGKFNSGTMTANGGTFVSASDTPSKISTQTISGVTSAEMISAGLPNTSSTFYFRCFGKLGSATTINIESGQNNVAALLTATSNVTIEGIPTPTSTNTTTSSSTRVAIFLAVAGSLAATLAF